MQLESVEKDKHKDKDKDKDKALVVSGEEMLSFMESERLMKSMKSMEWSWSWSG